MENRVQILKLENTDFMRLSTNMGGLSPLAHSWALKAPLGPSGTLLPVPIIETSTAYSLKSKYKKFINYNLDKI